MDATNFDSTATWKAGKDKQLAEIKSTMDIIMERTKGLSLSSSEREKINEEELEKRARGVRLKIEMDPLGSENYIDSAELEDEGAQAKLRLAVWRLLVEDVPTDETVFKYLTFLERTLLAAPKHTLIEKMKRDLRHVLKETVVDKKKALTKERKKLTAIGISGEAVMPKLPKTVPASEEFVKLAENYKKELLD